MTKFIIRDGNKLFLKERTHVDNMFLGSSFRETDLRTELKPDSIKKIFENPITAIAYDTTHYQHNIEMDKKSLTKALDFWINDKVLQNEKILFIEGKLDDVHEIELKNLIELREFVQKQDNDTVFTRFRESVSGKEYDFTKKSSWGVEFFVKRELVPNNIKYNYTSLFIGDGARWDFGSLLTSSDWFSNALSTATDHTSEALNDLSRALSRSNGAGTDVTQGDPNPYNWRISRMGNGVTFGLFDQTDALIRVNDTFMNNFPSASAAEESRRQHRVIWDRRQNNTSNGTGGRWIRQNQFDPTNYRIVPDIIPNEWKVIAGHDGTNIAVGFNSETDAQRFVTDHISNTTNRTFTLPAAGTETQMVGIAGEPLRAGDLIFRNEINRRWYRVMSNTNHTMPIMVAVRNFTPGEMVEAVRQGSFTTNTNGPDHLLHSNLHPGITFPPTPPLPPIEDALFNSVLVMGERQQNIRTTRNGLEYLQNMTLRSTRIVFENMRVAEADISISRSYEVTLKLLGPDISLDLIFHNITERLLRIANEGNESVRIELLGNHEVRINDTQYNLANIDGAVTFRYDNSHHQIARLRMEPSHPEISMVGNHTIPAEITSPTSPSNRIQDITFENLTIHPLSETLEAGENSYTMTTYAAQNGQYEMTFDLYVTGREIDRISEGFRTHTLRILEDRERGRMEIDGELYHYVNYTIRERIVNAGESFVPRTFLDMYIDRTSMERSPPMYALGSDINRGPIQYKIHLTSLDHKTEIELTIRDRNNTINNVLRHIRSQPVNVGILDREVTLNGYSYRTGEPPEVTYSSR